MRYLVISDIHSNAPALEAVLRDAPPYDRILCLGDIVGYGPNPNECISRLRSLDAVVIAGNHDWGSVGLADLAMFNHDARQALRWTQRELAQGHWAYLRELSTQLRLTDTVLLAHGSPRDPVWEYLVSPGAAVQIFRDYEFTLLLVGHSHIPLVFEWLETEQSVDVKRPGIGQQLRLDKRRLILNPGSVGQPRDGNPMASYAVMDMEAGTWVFHRVAYPVEITQERMRAAGLPPRLIDRLSYGQ